MCGYPIESSSATMASPSPKASGDDDDDDSVAIVAIALGVVVGIIVVGVIIAIILLVIYKYHRHHRRGNYETSSNNNKPYPHRPGTLAYLTSPSHENRALMMDTTTTAVTPSDKQLATNGVHPQQTPSPHNGRLISDTPVVERTNDTFDDFGPEAGDEDFGPEAGDEDLAEDVESIETIDV